MTAFKDRRSIRKYTGEDIPEQLLADILTTAARSATMGNMQLYSVVVTRDAEAKRRLAPIHFNQPMVEGAPVVLTVCADFNRFTKWCEARRAQPGYDNLLSFVNAASDALLFTQALCTLAEERGLGTCYLGTTIYDPQAVIDTLRLPRLTFPIATIALGWPDESPGQPDRLPAGAYVHAETYHDYGTDDIDRLYAAKEALEENRDFVAINHKENLAQVFTDCRYTRSDNEAISARIHETLRAQGFLK